MNTSKTKTTEKKKKKPLHRTRAVRARNKQERKMNKAIVITVKGAKLPK